MTLAEKIAWLESQANEIAFGYNDSGCFWHFQIGPRGAGNMMEGFGMTWADPECNDFEEAVDAFIEYLKTGTTR